MNIRKLGPASLRRMMGGWHDPSSRAPAYRQIEQTLKLLIMDGRLPIGVRIPGERNLAPELGVSRTTVAAAYAELRGRGFLASRHGSGSVTRLPRGTAASDTAELESAEIDFSIAALPAPKEVHAAYADALAELPRHLPGIGYEPAGLPDLRSAIARHYERRGLPTAPSQILVTQGAQQGLVLLLGLLARPGDRVVVDNPTYSKALEAIRGASCRPVGAALPAVGWDLDQLEAAIRQADARLAFLLPDYHNPTGRCMTASERQQTAAIMERAGCHAIIDETMADLWIDGPAPLPLAAFDQAERIICLGSMGKSFWGGLRMGWIRADREMIAALTTARAAVDMGSPIIEQIAATILLHDPEPMLKERRSLIAIQRDHLLARIAREIPQWRVERPAGGLSTFAEMPVPVATALARTAHALGVRIAAGGRFGVDGGFERYIRLPFALPVATLSIVADRLAAAWKSVSAGDRRPEAAVQPELNEAI